MGEALGSGYVLDRLIGRGAMGEVWRAHDVRTDETVAAKLLRPELASDPELVARFLQERAILESLRGDHLVAVRDLVAERDRLAIVMDLVDGTDLRKRLRVAQTLSPRDAVVLTGQVCSALGIVHSAGVVHRDVKPENVLLDKDGNAHLTDFGVSRIAHGASLTRLTSVVGTPNYLAPELARSSRATPAADVYAVGIMLYELLAGRTPFAGGDPMAVLMRHQIDEPPAVPDCPSALHDLIAATLQKDPGARPTASDLQAELDRLNGCLAGLEALPPMKEPEDDDYVVTSTSAPGRAMTPRIRAVTDGDRPGATYDGNDDESAPTRLRVPTAAAGAVTSPPTAPVRHPARRRTAMIVGTVAVVAAALLVASLVARPSPAPASPRLPAAKAPTFTFDPVLHDGKIAVARTWSLVTRKGDRLEGKLHLTNSTDKPVTESIDEVIPKSVAASVGVITFQPQPAVIKADPVVRWTVTDLAPGGGVDLNYAVKVPSGPTTRDRLAAWAADQKIAEQIETTTNPGAKPVTLQAITLDRRSISLKVGDGVALTLSGTMDDGTPAPVAVLAAAAWSSADAGIATVVGGAITAVHAGTTTISASIGTLRDDAAVAVGDVGLPPAPVAPAPVTIGAAGGPVGGVGGTPTGPAGQPMPTLTGSPTTIAPVTTVLPPTAIALPATTSTTTTVRPPINATVPTTAASVPGAPTLTQQPLVNDAQGTAVLSWLEPANGGSQITGYEVGRDGTDAHDVGDWQTPSPIPPSSRSFPFNFLAPANRYTLWVRAVNAVGAGPRSEWTITIGGVTSIPLPPSALRVSRSTDGTAATVAWESPASNGGEKIIGYVVARDKLDINNVPDWSKSVGAGERSLVFTNLVPGVTYTFTVKAVNSRGQSLPASQTG